jgi:hypothetical protein
MVATKQPKETSSTTMKKGSMDMIPSTISPQPKPSTPNPSAPAPKKKEK